MTIKKQFYVLISLVTLAVLLLMLVNHFNTKTVIEHSDQRIILGDISSSMLMLRRHEKDFLARKELKYVEKFALTFVAIEQQATKLKHKLFNSGMPVENIHSAVEQLESYNRTFNQLVATQKEIGLHAKDGLYGKLRSSVHQAETYLKAQQSYKLTSNMLTLRRNEKDFMLREDLKYLAKFDKNISVFSMNLASSDFNSQLKSDVQIAIDNYEKDFRALVKGYEVKGLSKTSGLVGDLRVAVHQVEQQLEILQSQTIEKIEAANKLNELVNLLLSSVLLISILATMLYISRSIRKPIDSFSDTIEKISVTKDLTIRSQVMSNNEIGIMANSFNTMIGEIQGVLQGAINSSDQVSKSAETMLEAMQKTSSYIEQQQVDNKNISDSITNIINSTTNVAKDAGEAEHMSQEANSITAKQGELTTNSIAEVRQLASEIKNTAYVISELEQESVNISLVLNVITEVSEQTNLLALNAAIEAARAGDQGRGFSVVADEVRLLAQRSQSSTEQIRTIIEKLQNKANVVSLAMRSGSEKMSASLKSSEDAGESFESISYFARNIRDINKEISQSAQHQSQIAQDVTENVQKVFESTTMSVEEVLNSARLSKELSHLSASLQDQIKTFKVA
jgi:methyl-accepting chemotaxis protein